MIGPIANSTARSRSPAAAISTRTAGITSCATSDASDAREALQPHARTASPPHGLLIHGRRAPLRRAGSHWPVPISLPQEPVLEIVVRGIGTQPDREQRAREIGTSDRAFHLPLERHHDPAPWKVKKRE